MNKLYTQELVAQAAQAGVPQEKIAALLQRAEEIASRNTTKTASSKNIDIVDGLLQEAGMQKTASSVSYVQGILNEAFNSGANLPQAIGFTKKALVATNEKIAFMEKVSAISGNPKLAQYADGFLKKAKEAGMGDDEALSLLVNVIDREKQAGGPDDMFKHAPSQGGPGGDPGAGAGGPPMGAPDAGGIEGPGSPGGDPQEAQILQMLQSLPPEEQQQIIQQLLAVISGGQGGPGGPSGPGAGGPGGPAGAPPPGPQPGGPQGPA